MTSSASQYEGTSNRRKSNQQYRIHRPIEGVKRFRCLAVGTLALTDTIRTASHPLRIIDVKLGELGRQEIPADSTYFLT
ncbi:MAG: hypothetical protein ACKOU6_06380 [Planctomycetota bacterium]